MGIRSRIISVQYAGRSIFSPGDRLNAEDYSLSRRFTTTGEPVVNADAPEITSSGNAEGAFSLPLLKDFRSEDEALAYSMELTSFFEANQKGTLVLAIGSASYQWEAGVTSVEARTAYFGSGEASRVRVAFTIEFILGRGLA